MSKNYREYFESFGLEKFPFDTYTTEHELSISKYIFVKQGDYDPIIDAFKAGRNIILTGERGSGKTAILEDFKRTASKEKNRLLVNINDFSTLDKIPTIEQSFRLLVSNITFELFLNLASSPFKLLSISKEDRLFLSYLLYEFLPPLSVNNLKDSITKIQIPFWKRYSLKSYNFFKNLLNYGGTILENVSYEYLIKHFSFIPKIENEAQIRAYFPNLKINTDLDFFDQEISLRLLNKVGLLSEKLGYGKPILILDRLDEDNRFENEADTIAEFVKPFLTNNNLLSLKGHQLIISIWSTPFRFAKDSVRTQKYYCPEIHWSRNDLEKLINKRLKYFSEGKISLFTEIFSDSVDTKSFNEIFELSNSNPRDLIHIFKSIFEAQYNLDTNNKITKPAINSALPKFVTNFNYYEYYPRKSNARANSMDIYSYSAHLLKLDGIEFTKNKLNTKAGTGSSTNNYVYGMEKIGLIENVRQEGGAVIYRIKDRKIVYALENNLELTN